LFSNQSTRVNFNSSWCTQYFKNQNPLVLELACGGGEYSIGLSTLYPHKNFIGIDIKGARIWKGASKAIQAGRKNVAFVRCRIELIHFFFGKEEIDELWITFPDPFPISGKAKKRLTSAGFLDMYLPLLKPAARIHLKTDDESLYEFSLKSIQEHPAYHVLYHHNDIYSQPLLIPEWDIKTHYEIKHLAENKKIKYIQFQKN
jgi:tRNA (guanine-N7-)-methyltransferase